MMFKPNTSDSQDYFEDGLDIRHRLDLSPEQTEALRAISVMRNYAQGEAICKQGQEAKVLFLLEEGTLKVTHLHKDGRSQILCFLFPISVCGVIQQDHYSNTIRCLTPCRILLLPIRAFQALLLQHTQLQFRFLFHFMGRLKDEQRHVMQLTRNNATERVISFLEQFVENAYPNKKPDELLLPMSHIDIAEYLDLAPETLSRTFSQLKKAGIISFKSPRIITVHDWSFSKLKKTP